MIENVDLRVAAGEHLAIVGASGAGKSTLLGLLLGFQRAAEGVITVDGAALDDVALADLRRHTAWIDPAVQLWNRSLLDNLCYAGASSAVSVVGHVVRAADLVNVVARLPDGLQTRLGEGGALLSGGEGQRVRLGRALHQGDVRLVLLDEPFRGLDRRQRQQQLALVREWWPHATLVCVTHDVAATREFPRVLVVDDGRLVEDGAPAVLLAQRDSRYRALLEAELILRRDVWQAAAWRRLHVAAGKVSERTADEVKSGRHEQRA